MTQVQQIAQNFGYVLKGGTRAAQNSVDSVFCCDLLSLAVAHMPEGCAWVTVMANKNTLAVAHLREAACVIFAHGIVPDAETLATAREKNIALLISPDPVFATAKAVEGMF